MFLYIGVHLHILLSELVPHELGIYALAIQLTYVYINCLRRFKKKKKNLYSTLSELDLSNKIVT